ncbi:MAG: hypothetical protein L3J17_13080 [Candidatus Jettenia sp.]|nr:MAG: hypothetical protein L3J17_13080 [Candidatus Jettenia sp.]
MIMLMVEQVKEFFCSYDIRSGITCTTAAKIWITYIETPLIIVTIFLTTTNHSQIR